MLALSDSGFVVCVYMGNFKVAVKRKGTWERLAITSIWGLSRRSALDCTGSHWRRRRRRRRSRQQSWLDTKQCVIDKNPYQLQIQWNRNKINGSASALHRDSFNVQLKTIRFAASNSPWHFLLASSHYHCLFPLHIYSSNSSIAVLSWNAIFTRVRCRLYCTYIYSTSTVYSPKFCMFSYNFLIIILFLFLLSSILFYFQNYLWISTINGRR